MTLVNRLALLPTLLLMLLAACASAPPSTPVSAGPSSSGPSTPAWANPTGLNPRSCDVQGCGHFGAPRGALTHKGADYSAVLNQQVVASTSGVVDKIGYPYANDLSFRYIRILANDGKYVRELYVAPISGLAKGDTVTAGMVIGTLQKLSDRYPDITEHVHLDINVGDLVNEVWIDPVPLIP